MSALYCDRCGEPWSNHENCDDDPNAQTRHLRHIEQLQRELAELHEAHGGAVIAQSSAVQRAEMLSTALGRIERWSEFPPATDRKGKSIPYGAAYGSNGERDYMRRLATAALGAAKGGKCEPHDAERGCEAWLRAMREVPIFTGLDSLHIRNMADAAVRFCPFCGAKVSIGGGAKCSS